MNLNVYLSKENRIIFDLKHEKYFFNLKNIIDVTREIKIQNVMLKQSIEIDEQKSLISKLNEQSQQFIKQIDNAEMESRQNYQKQFYDLNSHSNTLIKLFEYDLYGNWFEPSESDADLGRLYIRHDYFKVNQNQEKDLKIHNIIGWNCLREQIEIVNLNTNSRIKVIKCPNRISCLTLYDNESKLICGYAEKRPIEVFHLKSGKCLLTFEKTNDWLTCMKVINNNNYLATGHVESSIRIWDLENGKFLYFLNHKSIANTTVPFLDQFSNGLLISGHLNHTNTICVWDLNDKSLTKTFKNKSHQLLCLKVSKYDKDLFGYGTSNGKIKLFRLETQTLVHEINIEHKHLEFISSQHLITYHGDEKVRIWCLKSFNCLRVLEGHTAHISEIRYDINSEELVSLAFDKTVIIWNIFTGVCCLKAKLNDFFNLFERL